MRLATEADFIRIQGGRPRISRDGPLWLIRHSYLPGAPLVRTHRDPQTEQVALDLDGETVLFTASELWQFEGAPCELESYRHGGHGYRRSAYPGH